MQLKKLKIKNDSITYGKTFKYTKVNETYCNNCGKTIKYGNNVKYRYISNYKALVHNICKDNGI